MPTEAPELQFNSQTEKLLVVIDLLSEELSTIDPICEYFLKMCKMALKGLSR